MSKSAFTVSGSSGGGGGTVTSVTGTAGRITSSGGATPVINLDPAYVASVSQGGTGLATLSTPYGVVCAGTGATTALQNAGPGTAGQVLTSNGAAALPSWQASGGTGKIVQVVSATFTATAASSSSTFADTGITVSITPTLNTSKVLVTAMVNTGNDDTPNNATYLNLVRGATNLLVGDAAGDRIPVTAFPGSNTVVNTACSTLVYLDSPASAGATTYKVQFAASNNAGTVYINRSTQDNDLVSLGRGASTITAMEVLA